MPQKSYGLPSVCVLLAIISAGGNGMVNVGLTFFFVAIAAVLVGVRREKK